VNLNWLCRNLANGWRSSDAVADFVKLIYWRYVDKLPIELQSDVIEIGFRYPPPIREFRALVRSNAGSDAFVFGEVFDHRYYELDLPFRPQTILDLGANAGFATLYFSRRFPAARLACVEPVPENVALLEGNLRLNNIEADVFPVAVGVVDGRTRMLRQAKDYAHRVVNGNDSCSPEHVFEVPSMSIPSLLRKLGWTRIGLLKVDIEGYEAELFGADCAWLHHVDAMCVEWHNEHGLGTLSDLALRFGFRAPRLLPGIWLLTRD